MFLSKNGYDSDAIRKAIESTAFDLEPAKFPSDIEKMRELMEQNAHDAKWSITIAVAALVVAILTLTATIIGILVAKGLLC